MRELIIKDLLFHKRLLWVMGIFFPVYMGYFGSRLHKPGVFVAFGGFMYAIGALMLTTREDKFKCMAFNLSLPGTRRQALVSRYLLSWALMLLFYALGAAVVMIVPRSELGAAGFSPGVILASVAWMTLCFGALMPLTVRFGQVGIIVFLVFMQVFGIVALSLRFLTSDLRTLAATGKAALTAARASLGPAGFAAALVAAAVLLNLVSFGLSLRFFRRKDY